MNNIINCLIVDDEPLARSLIRVFLSKRPGFRVIGECALVDEARKMLTTHQVHALFLDINMPVMSGVDFLGTLKHPPKVVFTTAYAGFAAEAFDLDAVDYLVKPITEPRFDQALMKLREALDVKENGIFLKADGKLVKVLYDDILFLEALKDFTRVHLASGKNILVGEHLKAVEAMLPSGRFLRAHRSHVISLHAVTGVFGNTVEIGNLQLPVGGLYKDDLYRALKIS